MVKWYNGSLPRISRGFDYPWPHEYRKEPFWGIFYSCGQEEGVCTPSVVIETAGAMFSALLRKAENKRGVTRGF